MWIIVTMAVVLIIIIAQYLSRHSAPNPKEVKKIREATEQLYTELTGELTTLLNEYAGVSNHSTEETQMAWEKCNNLLQKWGFTNQDSVIQVFYQVRRYLHNKIPATRSAEYGSELYNSCSEFIGKLWDFYYQIAFTYDLAHAEQEALLNYLLGCFRKDGAYAHHDSSDYSVYRRHWSDVDVDWDNWDAKCIALLEEGCRKNSPLAMRCLADCYYKKIGVDLKDYDKAFSLYQQAAKLGDMRALYMLGQCYENSRGTMKNYQKAGDCYQYAYDVLKSQCPGSAIVQDCAKALTRLCDDNRWVKSRYSPEVFDCSNTPVMEKSNLAKLKQDMDKCLHVDLDTADLSILAVSIGMINEEIIKSFIECYEGAYIKRDPSQQIEILRQRGYFTKEMFEQTTVVRRLRNQGVHNRKGEPITLEEIKQAMRYIKNIVEYYEQF